MSLAPIRGDSHDHDPRMIDGSCRSGYSCQSLGQAQHILKCRPWLHLRSNLNGECRVTAQHTEYNSNLPWTLLRDVQFHHPRRLRLPIEICGATTNNHESAPQSKGREPFESLFLVIGIHFLCMKPATMFRTVAKSRKQTWTHCVSKAWKCSSSHVERPSN